jgi:hypothetical protein
MWLDLVTAFASRQRHQVDTFLFSFYKNEKNTSIHSWLKKETIHQRMWIGVDNIRLFFGWVLLTQNHPRSSEVERIYLWAWGYERSTLEHYTLSWQTQFQYIHIWTYAISWKMSLLVAVITSSLLLLGAVTRHVAKVLKVYTCVNRVSNPSSQIWLYIHRSCSTWILGDNHGWRGRSHRTSSMTCYQRQSWSIRLFLGCSRG